MIGVARRLGGVGPVAHCSILVGLSGSYHSPFFPELGSLSALSVT